MEKINNCTKPCFSNGSECAEWLDKNCDRCVKASRYKAITDNYTKCRCSIQNDIFKQYMGSGNDAIGWKSYEATRMNICPHIVPLGTPRKKYTKKYKGQLNLF